MTSPFGTSLRRNPDDPRSLLERIDAQIRERLEEAVDAVCLDLMVELRKKHGRPLPEEKNAEDRKEFHRLVKEFLAYLRTAYGTTLSDPQQAAVTRAEPGARGEQLQRLVEIQVALAKLLPDYSQRFEASRAAFVQERLDAPPPKRGLLDRLLGR